MSESLIDEVFRKAGGREALMKSLGTPEKPLSKQTMSDWKRAGCVPARHAVAVEKITGIERERLCPDFDWGREAVEAVVRTAANNPGQRTTDPKQKQKTRAKARV